MTYGNQHLSTFGKQSIDGIQAIANSVFTAASKAA